MTDFLSFDDLLKKEDGRRQFFFDAGSLGKIQMHELTAEESQQCFAESNDIPDDDMNAALSVIAKWACWMIKGAKPSAEEVKSIRKKFSRDLLLEVRDYGLTYSGENDAGREVLEKN